MVNTVERLGERFDFWIVTRDHDGKDDKTPYTTVNINEWNRVGTANVFYLSQNNLKFSKIRQLIEEIDPEVIYINSIFATFTVFVLLLRKLKKIKTVQVIVAPCGELSADALRIKKTKKKVYLEFAKRLKLYDNLIWKTSSEFEEEQVKKVLGGSGEILIAPDMPAIEILPDFNLKQKPEKKSGEIRFVFLSRIHPIKNLKFFLEILSDIQGKVIFDVFGPDDDESYVRECETFIKTMPSNIKVTMKGAMPNNKVGQTLIDYHFFVLPSLGENFGHVFVEALSAGCPLLISNRTPWLELENKCIGWDLPLENQVVWKTKTQFCVDMNDSEYLKLAANSRNYITNWLTNKEIENATVKVFDKGLNVANQKLAI